MLGEGFEPPNPEGADLQSAVFNHFTTPANAKNVLWSRFSDSNRGPDAYKATALTS